MNPKDLNKKMKYVVKVNELFVSCFNKNYIGINNVELSSNEKKAIVIGNFKEAKVLAKEINGKVLLREVIVIEKYKYKEV